MEIRYDVLIGRTEQIKAKSVGLIANGFKPRESVKVSGKEYTLLERIRGISEDSTQVYVQATPTPEQEEDMEETRSETLAYLKEGNIESIFNKTFIPEEQWQI